MVKMLAEKYVALKFQELLVLLRINRLLGVSEAGQQRLLGKAGGIVADGRDMASVVFPNADLKFRMPADLDERSRRRYTELVAKGANVEYCQVKEDIERRDFEDTRRDYGELSSAGDIVEIDTTNWKIEEQRQYLYDLVISRRERIKS